jgi:hypothetical protein
MPVYPDTDACRSDLALDSLSQTSLQSGVVASATKKTGPWGPVKGFIQLGGVPEGGGK